MKNKRRFALAVAMFALVAVLAIGGTIAWLTDETDAVENIFTTSDITITLEETTTDYKMVPGNDIEKDPVVTVEAGSEDCWLFVKVEESDNLEDFIDYDIADGWTPLNGVDGVYWRTAKAEDSFSVLADDKVTVLETVTKEMMTAEEFVQPTLTFTAYACQRDNVESVADAWAAAKPTP